MDSKKVLKLFALIILCEVVGSIGVIFTYPAIPTWYAFINKPFFSPPNWLFAPAWIILFLLMGVALYLILESKSSNQKNLAIILFAMQFFFNVLWSFLFFGLKSPLLGLIGIIVLWFSILATILSFYKISKKAAYLLIPYILWVSFATILNLAILLMNL
ncbi:MAG: TspO/MBR family protein [archaeon ADurb.Bin336]|jgi:tryptophan-rich sensory protein|nr:MAG: TspO/MBR family protein [archaeon ADurb.Bin336]